MLLHLTKIKVDGIHKVLVLDKQRTTEEGQLLYIAESKDQNEAMIDALEFTNHLYKTNSPTTIWQ